LHCQQSSNSATTYAIRLFHTIAARIVRRAKLVTETGMIGRILVLARSLWTLGYPTWFCFCNGGYTSINFLFTGQDAVSLRSQ